MTPADKRELVSHTADTYDEISLRQACILFGLSTSVYRYKPKRKNEDYRIMTELAAMADLHKRWGFWKMYHRLRHLQYRWNHKRVYRIYTEMRLNLRSKRKKRLPARVKEPLVRPIYPNVTWSLDFMHDTLADGTKIRSLNIIDDFNREVLALVIDRNLPARRVVKELQTLVEWRGKPEKIRVDNGPEFIAYEMERWCDEQSVELMNIQPGKPTQNSLIERFNRTFREDVLDSFIFDNIRELRKYAYAWMWMYNNERPHAGLGQLTPTEFLLKYGKLNRDERQEFPTFQQDIQNNWKSLILNVAK